MFEENKTELAESATPERKKVRKTTPTPKAYFSESTRATDRPKDIVKLLEARGIKNPLIQDLLVDLGREAAEQKQFVANKFFWERGYETLLASQAKDEALKAPVIPLEDIPGELLNRAELYAIWDYGVLPFEPNVTFEDFLNLRQQCKKSAFVLGVELLEKDFTNVHLNWTNHFPKLDPTALPPRYTQKEMNQWLDSISQDKNYMLLASRNSWKSSWSAIFVITLILNCPDFRILLISETQDLSKSFVETIKNHFILGSVRTKFQRYFPEYCFHPKDAEGKANEIISPMQRLNLASKGVTSTSQESSVVGKRCDWAIFDDYISNKSSDSEIQRASSKNYFNAMAKLRTVEGYIVLLGTPWHELDAYNAIIESNRKSNNWKIRIDPAWTVKEHVRHKKITELKEEDVTLLFPEHLSWKFLQSELSMNENFFRSQNLMEFPKEANWDLKVQFSEDILNRQTRFRSFFDTSIYKTYMALDRAYSTSVYADYSAIVTGRVQLVDRVQSLVVTDVLVERLKPAELALTVAKKINEFHPECFFFEKDRGYEELVSAVQQNLFTQFGWQRNQMPAHKAVEIPSGDRAKNNKAIRIKRLELPLEQRMLWFTAGQNWLDGLLDQMKRYQGKKSTSSAKDDMVDALSLLYEQVMPKNYYTPVEDEISPRDKEAEAERMKTKAMHQRMFSGPSTAPTPKFADIQAPQPQAPGMDIRGARAAMINRMLDNARNKKF